jgi:hypothetical protein
MFKTSNNAALGVKTFDPTQVDAAPTMAVGTIVKGFDDTLGEAEFIYLPGVANCAIGDLIVYDLRPGVQAITRTLSGTHLNSGRPVAVAIQPVGVTQYGFFQISGAAVQKVTAGSAVGKLFLTTTAGQCSGTAIAGCQVLGATISAAEGTPAANFSYTTLNRPYIQGQIT